MIFILRCASRAAFARSFNFVCLHWHLQGRTLAPEAAHRRAAVFIPCEVSTDTGWTWVGGYPAL
jgi:hypothetical protein